MRNDKPSNAVLEKSFAFSLLIIDYSESLIACKKYRMADQVFRCGTSIGANVREAQNAESRKDFIHKMKVAAKEADEAEYWLELCHFSPHYPNTELLRAELKPIVRLLSKIIGTMKRSQTD